MRKLHDSLLAHFDAIVALGEHRPPTGRIEALNNNWETLVRRGRGYRDLQWMFRRLRFMTVNPLRSADGFKRFVALGATPTLSCLAQPRLREPFPDFQEERRFLHVVMIVRASAARRALFCGSDDHAKSTAALYSLNASARLHRLDPEEYLRCLIRLVPLWPPDRMLELAPLFWERTRRRLGPNKLAAELGTIATPAEPLDTSGPTEQQAAS